MGAWSENAVSQKNVVWFWCDGRKMHSKVHLAMYSMAHLIDNGVRKHCVKVQGKLLTICVSIEEVSS